MEHSKIFVVAGNIDQFKAYSNKRAKELWEQGETSISLSNFVYVRGPEVFRGFNQVHGVFTGTYRNRPDIRDIVREIRRINQIPHSNQVIPDIFIGKDVFVVWTTASID